MINNKELQNIQRIYINSLEKRLNDAVSPAYRQVRQRETSLLPGYLLKKIFFLLKNKIDNDNKNINTQNRYIYYFLSYRYIDRTI
jgi:hypothetical protein